MSQSSVVHHSFIRAAWLVGRCQVPHSQVSHENSFLCVAGLIGTCGGRTDWHVWHVAVIYVAAHIDMCGMPQSCMLQHSLIRVTYNILMCHMPPSYACHGAQVSVIFYTSRHTHVTSHIHHFTHTSRHTHVT